VPVAPPPVQEAVEASWADVAPLDVLGLEVGYRLIPLVDKAQDGELLRRIRGIRKKFAQEVGFLVSPVHIRDNLELKPNAYRILLKGVESARARPSSGNLLAINPGRVAGTVNGTATKDPAFGLPATWIDAGQREQAQAYGYTVVDASTVVATHLNHLILTHAAELLGRQEVQQLLDHLAEGNAQAGRGSGAQGAAARHPAESAAEPARRGRPYPRHADHHRNGGRTHRARRMPTTSPRRCVMRWAVPSCSSSSRVTAKCRSCRSIRRLSGCWHRRSPETPSNTSIEPSLADTLVRETAAASQRQEALGCRRCCWCRQPASAALALPAPYRSKLKVLAHAEVPENRIIKVTSIIGGKS
jgi:flagellar biosynthesis protein FlhA